MGAHLRFVLLGPPGGGKGTQGKLLEKRYAVKHLAAGDILRHEVEAGTVLGRQAKEVMAAGALLEDSLIINVMTGRLDADDVQGGWILDGFPRTIGQADALDGFLKKKKTPLTAAIDFEIDDEEVVKRLTGRLQCRQCGSCYHRIDHPPRNAGHCDHCDAELFEREDDSDATIRRRLVVYRTATAALIEYYEKRGVLWRIPAVRGIDDVFSRICSLIDREGVR